MVEQRTEFSKRSFQGTNTPKLDEQRKSSGVEEKSILLKSYFVFIDFNHVKGSNFIDSTNVTSPVNT